MEEKLEYILKKSGLGSMFELKSIHPDHYSNSGVQYRVKTNIYRIRSFDLYITSGKIRFLIRHSEKMDSILKDTLNEIKEVASNAKGYVDFLSESIEEYAVIASKVKLLLEDSSIIENCNKNKPRAITSKFEGLDLSDIDTSISDVMGQTFTWKDIISIWEDNSEENELKKVLSENGIYIQRSKDGKRRYIGSAYGEHGIIGRWMKHLESNGDAQHLNLFVLENGYNEIVFSVIEFCDEDKDSIIQIENKWKNILGSINCGAYNGIQLNRN
ncbi:MAG: GIY-YIG nuclease family protein [Peptostreptococcaceae bacterium]